jgi:hypothetical protein
VAGEARQAAGGRHAVRGEAVQIDPIKPTLKASGTKRLTLKSDEPLSNVAFKFNLCRYNEATAAAVAPLLQRAWRGKRGRDAARSRRRALTFVSDRVRAVWLAHVKRRQHAVGPHRYCSPSHSTMHRELSSLELSGTR